MQNYKLTIAYDGTNYHGWQMQANARTIQGEMTRVLSLLDHRPVTLHGAGRTDAGVHAEAQVANVFLERLFAPGQLRDAINGNLDRDLRVMRVELADDSFEARFSAKSKTYRYDIATAAVLSPFDLRYVYHYRGALDADAMRRAAALLVGRHDFAAFQSVGTPTPDTIRTIRRSELIEQTPLLVYEVEGDGFLRHMVRAIVGTLVEVGRGWRTVDGVRALVDGGTRADAGATAPPHGLFLVRVDYD